MAMADQTNYYEVLGVPREASQGEIRTAYRRLAKERHPDHPSGSAQEFSLLQEAHAVLSDMILGTVEEAVPARRQERESGGPGLGERLRGRFRNKDKAPGGDRGSGAARRRGRYEARWYEPHTFDPEPVTWKTGSIGF